MSWQLRVYPAAFRRRQLARLLSRLGKLTTLMILVALAQGCAGPPASPLVGPDPSDPAVGRRAVSYRSTVAPYVSRRPVEPKPWREQSQQVAPLAKPQQ
jgi:hypothetical protein